MADGPRPNTRADMAARARRERKQLSRILLEAYRAARLRAELDGQLVHLIEKLQAHIATVERGAATPRPSSFRRLLRRIRRVSYGAPRHWIEAAESVHAIAAPVAAIGEVCS